MKRTYLAFTSLLLSLLFVGPAGAQGRSNAEQERVIRETYRKLETYNAAAQIFQNEMTRKPIRDALSFELTAFRSGNVAEIINQRYADLVTLPAGDIISLTRGGHSFDDGPQEATFAAQWEHGHYAAVFDPVWTLTDVFHFEAAGNLVNRPWRWKTAGVRFGHESRLFRKRRSTSKEVSRSGNIRGRRKLAGPTKPWFHHVPKTVRKAKCVYRRNRGSTVQNCCGAFSRLGREK